MLLRQFCCKMYFQKKIGFVMRQKRNLFWSFCKLMVRFWLLRWSWLVDWVNCYFGFLKWTIIKKTITKKNITKAKDKKFICVINRRIRRKSIFAGVSIGNKGKKKIIKINKKKIQSWEAQEMSHFVHFTSTIDTSRRRIKELKQYKLLHSFSSKIFPASTHIKSFKF